ncbi:MAG TPA: acetylglutamate kinase [Chroococcales cyanobacterium]
MVGYLTRLMQDKELESLVENKTIVIKLGGSMLSEQKETMSDIVALSLAGARVIVVHGGGPAINKALAENGVPTTKVEGMRVTDDVVLPVVASVLTGLNGDIVGALGSLGLLAEGVTPQQNSALNAQKHFGTTKEGAPVDIGWVGQVSSINKSVFFDVMTEGGIPVVAPLGTDASGQMYNINADVAAAAVAASVNADMLMLITDVPGVLADPNDPSSLMHTLTAGKMKELMASGVITGGMIPKLAGCVSALERGVKQVHIMDGHGDRPLVTALLKPESSGTRIIQVD